MLILGITNPEGRKKYIAAAFPSACGKTNLAMMMPTLPGWKVECVGDDIAWLKYGPDGRLWAINPENGFFGVAPGTSMKTNPHALKTLHSNCVFTNVALTPEGDVWWEGMTDEPPKTAINWLKREWTPGCGMDAAHPNSRFTAPARQCEIMDEKWEAPEGVPISAIIFGGRRSSVVPLVYQARDWAHGTFLGSVVNSETTAAAAGKRGVLRADPMAMKPFLGYNAGSYFQHWLNVGAAAQDQELLPKIFYVNWFRRGSKREFLWPGFGENSRVLKWIFERTDGSTNAVESPIGFLPSKGALDLSGLNVADSAMDELFKVEPTEWEAEVQRYDEYLTSLGDRVPKGIKDQLSGLADRLAKSRKQ